MSYHGEGCTEQLAEYCQEKGYSNICLTGRYYPEEIENFVADTDILLNLYENEGKQEYALTVKLYDGVRYQLPMLVAKDSFMEQYLKDYHFAKAIDLGRVKPEEISEWYSQLREDMLNLEFKRFAKQIELDDRIFESKLMKFVENK